MSKTACEERNRCGSPNKNVRSHITYRTRSARLPERNVSHWNSQRRSHNPVVCRLCADGHDASSAFFDRDVANPTIAVIAQTSPGFEVEHESNAGRRHRRLDDFSERSCERD